jgi:hypothetical protein
MLFRVCIRLYTTSLILFACFNLVNSQAPVLLRSTLGIGGASLTISPDGNKISFPQSIGQYSVTGVFIKNNLELRQGFIQPVIAVKSIPGYDKMNINIYPNPFSETVNIILNEDISGNVYLKIFDLAGSPVYMKIIVAEATIPVNLSSLSSGIYILEITINRRHFKYKIIKNQ